MHDNHNTELTPSNSVDDKKKAIYQMMEKLNELAANST